MKNKPIIYDDDFFPGSLIQGTGSYQRIGDPGGKTKFKHPVGFIRPKVKVQPTRTRRK
jgi:hypothetical protein